MVSHHVLVILFTISGWKHAPCSSEYTPEGSPEYVKVSLKDLGCESHPASYSSLSFDLFHVFVFMMAQKSPFYYDKVVSLAIMSISFGVSVFPNSFFFTPSIFSGYLISIF